MESSHKLIHLLGNFQDKLNIAPTISQPHLTEMILDLIQFSDYHQEKTSLYTISVMDILVSFFQNPNLTEDNFNLLYPKVLNPNFYGSVKETSISKYLHSYPFFTNNKKKELVHFIWSSYQKKGLNYLSQSVLKEIAKEVNNNKDHELYVFFQNKQLQLIKEASSIKLLFIKASVFKLKSFLEQNLLYISPNIEYVKNEIKSRKKPVPSTWKQYSSKNFDTDLTSSENQISFMKKQRKGFLTQLKNRVLTPEQIITESEEYIAQLNKVIQTLNNQKEEIESKIKDLKVPENPK